MPTCIWTCKCGRDNETYHDPSQELTKVTCRYCKHETDLTQSVHSKTDGVFKQISKACTLCSSVAPLTVISEGGKHLYVCEFCYYTHVGVVLMRSWKFPPQHSDEIIRDDLLKATVQVNNLILTEIRKITSGGKP